MKQNSRMINIVRSTSYGLLYKLITMLCPFIVRTVLIYKMGMEYAGLNSLFTAILQMLNLSELGVGSAITYYMYRPVAEENKDEICRLMNLYKKIYRIIGIVILAAGLLLLPFLEKMISGDYPNDINLSLLYLLYLANTVLSYFLFAYKSSILTAFQRNDIESKISTIVVAAVYAAQIISLIIYSNYYIYIGWLIVGTILGNVLRSVVVDRNYSEYEAKGEVDPVLLKEIINKVKWAMGHKMNGYVLMSADNLIISAFLGLIILAKYNNYFLIVSSLFGFLSIFYNSLKPSIGNSLVKTNMAENEKKFYGLVLVNEIIIGWACTCMLVLFQDFIAMWVGEKNLLPFSTVILLVIYFYIWKTREIVIVFKDAAGMWKIDGFRPYVEMSVNIVANILLVRIIGLNGVLISTIMSIGFVGIPWETRKLFHFLFQQKEWGYYKIKLYNLLVNSFAAVLSYVVCNVIKLSSFIGIITKLGTCTLICGFVFYFAYRSKDEYKMIKGYIRQILRKKETGDWENGSERTN